MAPLTRDEAQQVLARHGVDVTCGDVDPHPLATVASSHGWLSSVEPLDRQRGVARYHALVWNHTRTGRGTPTTIAARRQGRTAADALGLALATMLARQERSGPRPSNSR